MAIGCNLPRKRNNPRTVRGAEKRGWHIVNLPGGTTTSRQVSWLGINIWCDSQMKGYYVSSFHPEHKFAFEKEEDASWFTLKWLVGL